MKNKRVLLLIGLLVVIAVTIYILASKELFVAKPGPGSVKTDELTLHTSEFPKSFNYYVNNSVDAAQVFDLVYATLMELDDKTLEYQPLIAESWSISPDQKEITVKINPAAEWSDGTPITAEDVKFTYDVIMNPENLTSVIRMYLGRLNPPEIIDERTVKFTAKTVHYKNLEVVAGFNILPKHLMEGKDFNKEFNMSLPGGSGPYDLTEIKEGRYYVLTRKENYWADQLPHRQGTYNFKRIRFRVMNPVVAFEAFKKGEFDIYTEITAKRWVNDTDSEHFEKNWLVKQKIYNYAPRGFQGLALNMRRPLFQDLRVRRAIAHLLNRELILEKIMYGEYKPLTSYWPYLYEKGEKSNPLIEFNPEQAKSLLREAGYDRLDQTGYLVNETGRRLEFSVAYVSEESEKFLTVFVEDCKNAGVKVNLERYSWATLIKKMDQYDFDAVMIGWSGTLFPDPEQLWHSRHINEPGGSNLPAYQNPEVDRLIDSLPPIYDPAKRAEIIKKIDRIIYQDVPYLLFWEADYSRIFYKNIFGRPETVFSKYGSGIIKYWWIDPEKAERYQRAVKSRQALPAEPVEIHYHDYAGEN
ncbi:MAG: ABC transporter substrate-binding protein [Firmicutes bacterium]|nr:ABC transporter substrate-binding protein [Bacillota bacterium]